MRGPMAGSSVTHHHLVRKWAALRPTRPVSHAPIMSSRFNCQTANRHTSAFSRRDFARALHHHWRSSKQRAQGKPGADRTRGSVQKKHGGRTTGSTGSIRLSPRNGFTVSFVLSLVTGLIVTIAPEKLASQELDASVGASEPHDFAVLLSSVRQKAHPRPPHLTATFVTIASRPLSRVRCPR